MHRPVGLLETDLDAPLILAAGNVAHPYSHQSSKPKARSLLDLEGGGVNDHHHRHHHHHHHPATLIVPGSTITHGGVGGAHHIGGQSVGGDCSTAGGAPNAADFGGDPRAKSMEFLLDKENQAAIQVSLKIFILYLLLNINFS